MDTQPRNARRIRFRDAAPTEAVSPSDRISPIRKPPGFVPAVQRWSFLLPPDAEGLRVAFFGAQARTEEELADHPMFTWLNDAVVRHRSGPTCFDHSRQQSSAGFIDHVLCAYWVDEERFQAWSCDPEVSDWWLDPARLQGPFGSWKEILKVPRHHQESIYWRDYPAGLMLSDDVEIFPTPYCGYYGAMRDRIPAAAYDRLDPLPGAALFMAEGRAGFGEHWAVKPPKNLAVIRSAHTWQRLEGQQLDDYREKLREPLNNGMDYLINNPLPTGCASLRWQTTTDERGNRLDERHALGYFLSLGHMERWAEGHDTHAAIFDAAMTHYKMYGKENQLRTWHEVFVLPGDGQVFEYLNCAPGTGLLARFPAELMRRSEN